MAEASSNNKRIAKNTIALYFRLGITMVISFFTARITLQVLGVDDYGLNNLVGSIVAMFSFLNGSIGTAVQRFYSIEIGRNDNEKLKKVFGVGMYLHILVALITLVIAEIFAFFFLSKMNIPPERMFAAHVVFQISIVSMVLGIVTVPYFAFLRAKELFSKTAMIDIFVSFARLGVLYLLYTINYDKLIVLSSLNFFVTTASVLAYVFLSRQFQETKFHIDRDKALMKEMLGFISLLVFTVLAQVCRDQGKVILINLFFGLAINGAYAVAAQVSNIVNTFALNFKQSVVPQIVSSFGEGNKDRMNKLITTGTKITTLMLLVLTLPIIFECNFLLSLWLKDVPDHAVTLTRLILININFASLTYFYYQAVHATGNIKFQQMWMIVAYGLNIVLILAAFALGFSFEWAIYITIATSIFQCAINIYCAKRQLDLDILVFFREIVLRGAIVAVLLSAALYAIILYMDESFIRLIVTAIAVFGVGIGAGLLLFLRPAERAILLNMIRKKN